MDNYSTERKAIKFVFAYDFTEGLALIVQKRKCGFINKQGVLAIPFTYQDAKPFSEGLAPVMFSGKWGYIDANNTLVIPFRYDDAELFQDGEASVLIDERFFFIDKEGVEIEVKPPEEPAESENFVEGLAAKSRDGKWGFVNQQGEEVIPFIYSDVYPFSDGLALVEDNDRYGFIDKRGTVVIPIQYEDANPFSEGLASVSINGKSGYIDTTGKELIPIQYLRASSFSDGMACIKLDVKRSCYINKAGEKIILLEKTPKGELQKKIAYLAVLFLFLSILYYVAKMVMT